MPASVDPKTPFNKRIMMGLEPAFYSALDALGRIGVEKMRENILEPRPYPAYFSGELHDGITYGMLGTSQSSGFPANEVNPGNPVRGIRGPKANDEHLISKVKAKFKVHIGTADPKGKYIEYGTGPHKKPDESEEFVAKIKAWCAAKGVDEDFAAFVIKKIRRTGTSAHPFRAPTKQYLEQIAKQYFVMAVRKGLKAMPKVRRTIEANGSVRYRIT
jgi:hypothetical protein